MKPLFSILVAFALLVPFTCEAQNITTNWVLHPPYIREVGGRFYNVDHSLLFTNFSGTCERVFDNGILLHEYHVQTIFKTYGSGNFLGPSETVAIGSKVTLDRNIFVLNFPTNNQPTTGSTQSGKAMKIGVTNVEGETVELLDFGRRHLIPILQTNGIAK